MDHDEDEAQETQEGLEVENAVAPTGPIEFPDDAVNLVPIILEAAETDPRAKKYIDESLPGEVYDSFKEDCESRKPWMDKLKEISKLYLGDLEPKKQPFANCANMHEPILLERLLRLAARVYAELFPVNAPLFEALPAGALSKDRAEIVTLHDNWQFTKDIPDFKQQIRRALQEFFKSGHCVIHSYFDADTGKNRHEYLGPEEFVFPYTWKPPLADMSDVPRKTRVWRKYKRQILSHTKAGDFCHEQVERLFKQASEGNNDDGEDHPLKDLQDKFHGKDRTENKTDAPYMLLEQHTFTTFPGHDDETAVRVVMEYSTKTVLAIYKREIDDPEDSARFDRENQEYAQYVVALEKHLEAAELEQQLLAAAQQPGVDPEESAIIAQQTMMDSPPPPVKPEWMQFAEDGMPQPPNPCRKKILEQFSIGTCIENPDGSLGLGVGTLLMPFQKTTNILLNQFVDAGTLANSNTLVAHENLKFPPGVTSISPNTINRVRGLPPDGIEKSIWKLPTTPPNPQLLSAYDRQKEAADGVASAPDVLSGEKNGPETFRGQATRVEQAVKQLTVFAQNFVEMLTNVAKNNALLNYYNLPDWKLVTVLDPRDRKARELKVERSMYKDDYAITFTADLRFASKAQRIAEADDVLGMLTKGIPPELFTQVFPGPQVIAAAVRKCLSARDQYDLVPYVMDDRAIAMRMQQQAMAAQQAQMMAGPGGPPGVGGPQPPAIPSGKPTTAPGAQPPQNHSQQGVPAEAAPSQ